ncbi:MAG: ROK family protein, partial [Alistipes sp.]|nr:ROK family protein [Alistipes sp.]
MENYYFIKKGLHIHIPMVCFTDLPNGICGKHKRRYGNYAIVFNKDWAANKHISPILYLRKDGQFTNTIRKVYKQSDTSINNELFAFCKPYCAKYYDHKKGKWSEKNRRFYDEREWRYVPKNYTEYVGCGIANLINIFQPEMLVIGGGVCNQGDYLLNPIKEYCEKEIY